MSLLYLDGFECQDQTLRYTFSGTGTVNNVTSTPFGVGRAMEYAVQSFGSAGSAYRTGKRALPSAASRLYIGFYFQWTLSANAITEFIVQVYGDTGATRHGMLSLNCNTGVLSTTNGVGTVVAAGIYTLNSGDWNYIEYSQTVSDTVGIIEVRINGVIVSTFTGDTKNAGTNTTLDAFALGGGTSVANAQNTPLMRWDDVYVCSSAGSSNNNYLGPKRVQTLFPNGAGASTQWTPSAGANYTTVNDSPDVTTSFVNDTTTGHRDTYTLDDLTAGTANIAGVQQSMHALNTDAGSNTMKQAQKSGATVSYGGTKALSAATAWYGDPFDTNPATSAAYTVSEVNALEAGVEVV